jgi:hypothetical protein
MFNTEFPARFATHVAGVKECAHAMIARATFPPYSQSSIEIWPWFHGHAADTIRFVMPAQKTPCRL